MRKLINLAMMCVMLFLVSCSPNNIPGWVRQTTSGGTQTSTAFATAQSAFGSSQIMAFLKFSVTGVTSGNWGPHGDWIYLDYNSGQVIFDAFSVGSDWVFIVQ